MNKKILISAIVLFFFFMGFLSFAADYKYVGSSKSDKYHYPSCQWAKKINPANLVTFKSVNEAQKAGYVPCKVCTPPIKD